MDRHELRRRRKALGLKQSELADVLGVAENTVLRWEIGRLPLPSLLSLAIEAIEARVAAGGRSALSPLPVRRRKEVAA